MNELMKRDPNIIAAEINAIKTQARNVVLTAAMEIGKRLTEVKVMLPHGTWGTWLEDNVDYSERTAQNLMSVYATYGGIAPEKIEGMGFSQAVALLGVAREEIETVLEERDVASMTSAEVEELGKALREEQELRKGVQLRLDALEGADKRERQAIKDRDAAIKVKDEAEKEKAELKTRVSELENAAIQTPEQIIIEKIPEETEEELARLREIAAKAPSAPVIKFRQIYEDFQTKTTQAIACIKEIEAEDPDVARKYRNALTTACRQLINNLNGGAEE